MNSESTENPDASEATGAENDMVQALNALKCKNAELRAILTFERRENVAYKARYKYLTEKVNNVNVSLEKNVRTYFSLFEDSKNVLHMGRSALLSPALSDSTASIPSPKPGPSDTSTEAAAMTMVPITRKKIPIGRIELKELQKSLDEETEPECNSHKTPNNSFKTPECSKERIKLGKEVQVRLSRLPNSVIKQYLQKSDSQMSSSTSSLSLEESFLNNTNGPDFTSTPLKLEIMQKLGLCPIKSVANFVNVRKPASKPQGIKRTSLEPLIESPLPKNKKVKKAETPKSTKINVKKNKAPTVVASPLKPKITKSPVVGRSPKARRAKPQQLKEPNCKQKMRRGIE